VFKMLGGSVLAWNWTNCWLDCVFLHLLVWKTGKICQTRLGECVFRPNEKLLPKRGALA